MYYNKDRKKHKEEHKMFEQMKQYNYIGIRGINTNEVAPYEVGHRQPLIRLGLGNAAVIVLQRRTG